jgi:hypothetical protein
MRSSTASRRKSQETTDYAANSMDLYDLKYERITDYLDKSVPTIAGAVKNKGNKTVSYVKVTAFLSNSSGQTIYEDSCSVVTHYGFMGNRDPLKPNYVREWRFKLDEIPSEWEEGNVKAAITDIEFQD